MPSKNGKMYSRFCPNIVTRPFHLSYVFILVFQTKNTILFYVFQTALTGQEGDVWRSSRKSAMILRRTHGGSDVGAASLRFP